MELRIPLTAKADPDTDIDAEGEIDTTQHGDPNVVSVEVSVAIKNPIDIT